MTTTAPIAQVGCFKIGSKVVRGNGKTVYEIISFRAGKRMSGEHFVTARIHSAKVRTIVFINEISLAGPNGDGVGA